MRGQTLPSLPHHQFVLRPLLLFAESLVASPGQRERHWPALVGMFHHALLGINRDTLSLQAGDKRVRSSHVDSCRSTILSRSSGLCGGNVSLASDEKALRRHRRSDIFHAQLLIIGGERNQACLRRLRRAGASTVSDSNTDATRWLAEVVVLRHAPATPTFRFRANRDANIQSMTKHL